MELKVFAVYDTKAEAYLQPFFMQTRGQAIRAWMDTLADTKTQFARHPDDFVLYELGTYDDRTGSFSNEKLAIGTAREYRSHVNNIAALDAGARAYSNEVQEGRP